MTIPNLLYVEAGYLLPWDEGGFAEEQDQFRFTASIPKGAIPIIDISASFTYDKMMFIEGLKDLRFLDEYTVIKGELVYPIAPTLDLAGIVTTSAVYDAANDEYDVAPVISIETRIHF